MSYPSLSVTGNATVSASSSLDTKKSWEHPFPKRAITHHLNPYDNSQFGDRLLGSFASAYLIWDGVKQQFPEVGFIGKNQKDFTSLQVFDEMTCFADYNDQLDQHYDYKIRFRADPQSCLVKQIMQAQTTHEISLQDLEGFSFEMQAVLLCGETEIEQISFQGKEIVHCLNQLIQKVPIDDSLLIEVPYCSFSEFDLKNYVTAEGRMPLLGSLIDLEDSSTRKKLQSVVRPKEQVSQIPFEEGCVPVVMQVRTGGNFDSQATIQRYPGKFPPLSWYVMAIRQLQERFKDQKIQIHIAIDKDAESVKKQLSELFLVEGIQNVAFTPSPNAEIDLWKMDLWGGYNIKALICADSSFGSIIGLQANEETLEYIIMPKPCSKRESCSIEVVMEINKGFSGQHKDVYANASAVTMAGSQMKIDMEEPRIICLKSEAKDRELLDVSKLV